MIYPRITRIDTNCFNTWRETHGPIASHIPPLVRYEQNHLALKKGLKELGLQITSEPGHQLWQLNAVGVPAGVDEATVRKQLLTEYNIEIGAGLGPLKGKIWRIGLMGETSSPENVATVLKALRTILKR